jgi:hypothetical protein
VADCGPKFGTNFAGAMGALGSHKGLKRYKVKKATELPSLFEFGRK